MNDGKGKRTARESVSAAAQFIGVLFLVFGLAPFINPGLYRVRTGHTSPGFFVVAIPVAIGLVLIVAGRVCQHRLNTESPSTETPLQKTLKWILFAILVAAFLYGF